jgi:signal transduction histidine kinase
MVFVTVLAVFLASALVVLTTSLNQTTVEVASSVESVRLAEETQINLLLHERARDTLVKRDIEEEFRRKLDEARRFVTTEHESQVLAEAESQVEAYIAAARNPLQIPSELTARQEAAYGALEHLVTLNVAQSLASQQLATRWNMLSNMLGVGIGVLLILIAAGLLFWLKGRAFEPIFRLAGVMDRFARGDRDVRAEERGPLELREMCRRFNEMATAISAQRRDQMAFLGGVAHDLRDPLSALQTCVELLPPDRPLPSEDILRLTIERLRRQIMRMQRMIDDFLDISNVEAGRLRIQVEAHDARALVRDVVDLFDRSPSEGRLEISLPKDAVPLYCDHLRIEQVITNLISNAIKYSPMGGPIEVAVEPSRDEVVLRVSDHGVGIAEEDRQRIFEPFRRVGLSREAVPGVGLGLFVVQRIVEAHGGHIKVESSVGQGSTFRVHLPQRAQRLNIRPVG